MEISLMCILSKPLVAITLHAIKYLGLMTTYHSVGKPDVTVLHPQSHREKNCLRVLDKILIFSSNNIAQAPLILSNRTIQDLFIAFQKPSGINI